MKLDKFTWAVIGIVVLLLAAAVVTVNLTGGSGWQDRDYITEDVPEAPVYNAFLALQQGDVTRAREQYSSEVLEQMEENPGYDPFTGYRGNRSSRLRITDVERIEEEPPRALVSLVQDNYNTGGLFGSGSTWSREMTVEVVREEDGWKLNTQEMFY